VTAAVVRVDGGPRLRRTLRQAGADMVDLKDANARIAAMVAALARSMAPVGVGTRAPGSLRASIRGNRAMARARVSAGGARVPYAGPVHWGWPARGIRPRPFLRDAARALEPTIIASYTRNLDTICDSVKGA
jgi:hypothetical protein